MSQKKETLSLLLSIVLTSGLSLVLLLLSLMEHWGRINNNSSTTNSANQNLIQNPSNNIINPNPPPVSNCKIPNLPQGIFSYSGSTTWAPIRRDVDSVLKNSCPQFDLRYTQPINEKPGSGTGIKMLIANQLAFSQSSRPVKPEENETAKTKGFSLKEITVAIDGIAIAVNHYLNIPGLTVSQLKDIYTGKITNWQQVGGENLPIITLSRSKESGGSVDFFVENVMNKEDFKNVNYIGTTTEAIRKVAITPGAIYYASAPGIVPQCIIKSLAIGQTTEKFDTL